MDRVRTLFLLCPALLFTTVTSDNVCHRPTLGDNVEVAGLQRFFRPGEEVVLSCRKGYTPVTGSRKIVCTIRGEWTPTFFTCTPKPCPYPDELFNGELHFESAVYQSTVNYTCREGYTLTGSSSAVCQANGTWSSSGRECTPVICGLAPIPQFGMIMYDRRVSGNGTEYGTTGTYKCRPPYALIGDARAECTAYGTWTKTPKCQVVTCPPPQNIERGYMSSTDQRNYDYMETIKYGCENDYVMDGSLEIVCQQNGEWSKKPSCNAPCRVDVQRGRILHRGRKTWIERFQPNQVLHKETVSVYCKDEGRNCGYAVSTQCLNGSLKIPECFEEPSNHSYRFRAQSLPSEIDQC